MWTDVTNSPYEWIPAFNEIMRNADLPDMTGSTLYVTSDYSGQHSGSNFLVDSVLIVDIDNSPQWPLLSKQVRQQYLPDGRRMCFKRLNDAMRMKALPAFMHAAGTIHGLIASVAVDKRVKGIATGRHTLANWQGPLSLKSSWTPRAFDRLCRMANFIALLLGGISCSGQNIYWVSDEDQIVANDERKSDAARMLSAYTSLYVQHPLGELGIGTTALDPGDRGEEDLAAIPDLVAGALAESVTAIDGVEGWPFIEELPLKFLSHKTAVIVDWLYREPKRLKAVVLVHRKIEGPKVLFFNLDLD